MVEKKRDLWWNLKLKLLAFPDDLVDRLEITKYDRKGWYNWRVWVTAVSDLTTLYSHALWFYGSTSHRKNKTLQNQLFLGGFIRSIYYINKHVLNIKTTFRHKHFSTSVCRVVSNMTRTTFLTTCPRIFMELCRPKLTDVLSKFSPTQLDQSILLLITALEMFWNHISAFPNFEQHMSSSWTCTYPKSLSSNLTNNGFNLNATFIIATICVASENGPFFICPTSLLLSMEK